ncbi:dehydrogenase/reductase SDR family member 7C-B-like isoform X2 [Syngnathoides biaculeatus]|nr:dehydrogenase/reductase SDR family member 7C-B-like isoform X2 [Syngnathoides biaculeatus]
MEPVWTTTVLLVPCSVVLTAGFLYVYSLVLGLLSKSSMRNKVVVISDALSSLGNECSGIFHKGGARLILCGKSWEKLQELSDDLLDTSDPSVTFPPKLVLLDFGNTEALPEAIREILESYGCVDVLILNSSMKLKAPAHILSLEMDKKLMDNNYFGPVTLAKGLLPSMMSRRSGHLVVVNSIQGKLALPFRTSYAASKHAIQAFFDCLRSEVAGSGISVSTINLTFISSGASGKQKDMTFLSYLYTKKPLGISPHEAASEVAKTLANKRKEVLMVSSLPKVALYARSFFPNVFFAVMAAGVKDTTNTKMFREIMSVRAKSDQMAYMLSSRYWLPVEHDRQNRRFTVSRTSGTGVNETAVLNYRFTAADEVDLVSTFVPEACRGQGVAALLSKAAIDFVLEEKLKARVSCWYIRKYMEEHPHHDYKAFQIR